MPNLSQLLRVKTLCELIVDLEAEAWSAMVVGGQIYTEPEDRSEDRSVRDMKVRQEHQNRLKERMALLHWKGRKAWLKKWLRSYFCATSNWSWVIATVTGLLSFDFLRLNGGTVGHDTEHSGPRISFSGRTVLRWKDFETKKVYLGGLDAFYKLPKLENGIDQHFPVAVLSELRLRNLFPKFSLRKEGLY